VWELWRKRGGYSRYWVNVRDKASPYINSKVLTTLWLVRFLITHTRLFIPRNRRRSPSCGNHRHSSRIAFVNLAIFWQCGFRWFTLRPIKSHTCSIGFTSRDMADHWNVSSASCLNTLTMRALCGLT
jgi:hypothetical protein